MSEREEHHAHVEEQLSESELGHRITEALRRHGRTFAVAAAAVVAVVIIALLWVQYRRQVTEAGFTALRSAEKADALQAIARDYRGTPAGVLAEFRTGTALLSEERYDEARAAFAAFANAHADHPAAPHAAFLQAVAVEGAGDLVAAADAYQAVAAEADHPRGAEALASAARCFDLSGNRDAARRCLEDLLARYPESRWVFFAQERLAEWGTVSADAAPVVETRAPAETGGEAEPPAVEETPAPGADGSPAPSTGEPDITEPPATD